MSVDALINAVDDNAIWRAMYPEKAKMWEYKLNHWVKTGHIKCGCDIRPLWDRQ